MNLFGDAWEAAREAAKAEHRKAVEIASQRDRKVLGFADLGCRVARLSKLYPAPVEVAEEGHLFITTDMDRDGGRPVLEIFQDNKRTFDVIGRANLDVLANLLLSAGYGRTEP